MLHVWWRYMRCCRPGFWHNASCTRNDAEHPRVNSAPALHALLFEMYLINHID